MDITSVQVFVEIKRNHITVKIPAGENTTDMKTLVDDELHREASYSTWSLESGKEILVSICCSSYCNNFHLASLKVIRGEFKD